MLDVVYNGTQKFHNYLYGRKFTIECDHEPLQHIWKKNMALYKATRDAKVNR